MLTPATHSGPEPYEADESGDLSDHKSSQQKLRDQD